MQAHLKGISAPLRTLAEKETTSQIKVKDHKDSKVVDNFTSISYPEHVKEKTLPLDGIDPFSKKLPTRMPRSSVEPTLVLEGIGQATANIWPPDPNGDVSKDHYIQIINASWFRVFDKDGTPLTNPTSTNTLWAEIGESSIGDPIINYDESADRWLLTDLAGIDQILYAVSETSDPLGSWFLYTFNAPAFVDYPKYGIWPTAYIFTANEAGTGGGRHPVYCINREQILNCEESIDIQRVDIEDLQGGFPTLTPMDWISPMMPATDEVHVARINDDAWSGAADDVVEVWSIVIDWIDPTNTTFSSTVIPTAPYDSGACDGNPGLPGTACVSQPGVGRTLDGIMTILMNNVVYYNYGTHESAVYNMSVNAGDDMLTVRWGELRRAPGGDWELYQEGGVPTQDSLHRWMGSISINSREEIALAYSVSGDTLAPSLRYTGRLAEDPLGEMTFEERQFADGLSSFTTSNRYGDYSKMTVDPIDDSFWFTAEYIGANAQYASRIVQFRLSRDSMDILPTRLLAPETSSGLTDSETVVIEILNDGIDPATDITVGYILDNGTEVTEMATIDTLFTDSTYVHTFTTQADLSVPGSHNFRIFTSLNADEHVSNDSINIEVTKVPGLDLAARNIRGLESLICSDAVDIEVDLINLGADPLTNFNLNYELNGGPRITTPIIINNLQPKESTTEVISLEGVVDGDNDIRFFTDLPNNQADEVPLNDTLSLPFTTFLDGVEVTLFLLTDNFPGETSYNLMDSDGNILFEGDDFNGQQTLFEISWCLDDEQCYTFNIFDSYGDGITFGGVTGDYQIVSEGNSLASLMEPNFGTQETNTFCLNVPCNLTADVVVQDASTSNSNDGAINVTILSGMSPFMYSINNGLDFSPNSMFPNLDDGEYQVVVTDANNCVFEIDVTVDATVSNNETELDRKISVSPNPSTNGAFLVKIEGITTAPAGDMKMKVLDASGKVIAHEFLARMNNRYEAMISLNNHPAGTYYFQFMDESLGNNRIKKVIKL
jgi:hypothetical protein